MKDSLHGTTYYIKKKEEEKAYKQIQNVMVCNYNFPFMSYRPICMHAFHLRAQMKNDYRR